MLGSIISKDEDYQLVVSNNEDVEAVSFLYFHGDNIEDSDKQYIVTSIKCEAIIPSIEKTFFYQLVVDFVNKLV